VANSCDFNRRHPVVFQYSQYNKLYSVKNTTIVYDIGILLWQHISVFFRPAFIGKSYNQCVLYTVGGIPYTGHSENNYDYKNFVNVQMGCKVKQFHYRPGQALRFPGGRGSQISRQSAHEGGNVVSPTHLYAQETFLVLISVKG
jgi:hypothetical protein